MKNKQTEPSNELKTIARLIANLTTALILCGLILSPLVGGWVLKSHFEAKSFNRLTESQATTWDAMWVQLRVEGNK